MAVGAAYRAAAAGRAVAMIDLVRETEREYRKLGRLVVESEFGSHYRALVEAAGPADADHGTTNGMAALVTAAGPRPGQA